MFNLNHDVTLSVSGNCGGNSISQLFAYGEPDASAGCMGSIASVKVVAIGRVSSGGAVHSAAAG